MAMKHSRHGRKDQRSTHTVRFDCHANAGTDVISDASSLAFADAGTDTVINASIVWHTDACTDVIPDGRA